MGLGVISCFVILVSIPLATKKQEMVNAGSAAPNPASTPLVDDTSRSTLSPVQGTPTGAAKASVAPVVSPAADIPPGAATTTSPTKATATPETDRRIGEEFKLGDYTYRITGFSLSSKVGSDFSKEIAEEGETFVLVSFTIRNDTNKTQQVLADDFKIKDQQGREFSNDSAASTALMMSGGKKDFLVREIQPGLTSKGTTVFKMPTDAVKQRMVLLVPQKGLFSSKKMTVILVE